MARMTEKEASVLSEEIANANITLTFGGEAGVFTRQRNLIDALDRISADYIMIRATAANKMPLQILNEVVREKIAASV
jgi:hypothetical protein